MRYVFFFHWNGADYRIYRKDYKSCFQLGVKAIRNILYKYPCRSGIVCGIYDNVLDNATYINVCIRDIVFDNGYMIIRGGI